MASPAQQSAPAPDVPMVRGFKGLNTRAEPTALGWEWLLGVPDLEGTRG